MSYIPFLVLLFDFFLWILLATLYHFLTQKLILSSPLCAVTVKYISSVVGLIIQLYTYCFK